MKISLEDVMRVAELAHLGLSAEEAETYQHQLDAILTYVDKLNELDVTHVEPMAQVTYPSSENPSLRSDSSRKTFEQVEALANAPEPGAGAFKVPHVIDREE